MIASSLERVLQSELTKFRAHVRVSMSDWRETLAPISKSVSFVNKVKVLGCSCRIEATKMPLFRENRTSLLCAFDSGVINEEEFVLLYDINTAKSPDLPYWTMNILILITWTTTCARPNFDSTKTMFIN